MGYGISHHLPSTFSVNQLHSWTRGLHFDLLCASNSDEHAYYACFYIHELGYRLFHNASVLG